MEDALAPSEEVKSQVVDQLSLNPCFNGRCTRTDHDGEFIQIEGGLNPCFNGRCTRTYSSVPVSTTLSSS